MADDKDIQFISEFDEFAGKILAEDEEPSESFDIDMSVAEESEPIPAGELTPTDALYVCINKLGRVDIQTIAELCGRTPEQTVSALSGSIFQNPLHHRDSTMQGWELKEEYLSGNLYEKLMIAREAEKQYPGRFAENITALSQTMPSFPVLGVIRLELGNPIISVEELQSFIRTIFKCETAEVGYSKYFNRYRITGMEYPYIAPAYYTTTGESLPRILERILNLDSLEIFTTVNRERQLDKYRTEELRERVRRIKEAFSFWLRKRPSTHKAIVNRYYKKFMCIVPRKFDGSYLELAGANPLIELKPHQKNAVARIISTPNVLLAHSVGTGKTFIMAAGCMELKRLHLIKRAMFVVPNHIVEQWVDEFHKLYPQANLISVTPKTFTVAKRRKLLERLQNEDVDGIIIAYSCFDNISLSADVLKQKWHEEKADAQSEIKDYWSMRESEKVQKKINKKYDDILAATKNAEITFDALDIDLLCIDEAHNYKNLYLDTNLGMISGFSNNGSKKCDALLEKVRYVQQSGRGVVFATGTPICNNLSDIFVMQRYLQNAYLRLLEIDHFDTWVQLYAVLEERTEIDVVGNNYRVVRRFSRYNNLPELSNIVAEFCDVYLPVGNEDSGIVAVDKVDTVIYRHEELSVFIDMLVNRAEAIHRRRVKDDNMLMVTTDGRLAALDLRLLSEHAADYEHSKLNTCVRKVFSEWRAHTTDAGTQIIFCDQSTPKKGFNVYDEIKWKLIELGVPSDEIAYVHDADSADKMRALYRAVNAGRVRILMGSTPKLGIGANVQERLFAIHHLDIPWRPADMVQREGRMIRRGNTNSRVAIYRYIVKGSFDAYSWQVLENKQRFIAQFLAGDFPKREEAVNIDETVLSYAEVKALAVNNPDVKLLIEQESKLQRLIILRTQHERTQLLLQDQAVTKPIELEELELTVKQVTDDWRWYSRNFGADTLDSKEFDMFDLTDEGVADDNFGYNNVAEEGADSDLEYGGGTENTTTEDAPSTEEVAADSIEDIGFDVILPDAYSAVASRRAQTTAEGYKVVDIDASADSAATDDSMETKSDVTAAKTDTTDDTATSKGLSSLTAYSRLSGRESTSREVRTRLGRQILDAVDRAHSDMSERVLFDYCGFKVIIPPRVQIVGEEHILIHLQRRSRYNVIVGSIASKVLSRIDTVLAGLDARVASLSLKVYRTKQDIENIKAQLGQSFDRDTDISDLQESIRVIKQRLTDAKKN